MNTITRWLITIGGALLVGLVLVCLFTGLFALRGGFGVPFGVPRRPEGFEGYELKERIYSSNGELIYFTGINEAGQRIPFSGGPMWLYMRGGGYVSCHGVDGRGGVPVMMGTEIPPDIRYEHLTEEEHEEEGEEHPPYTDETIKRAITEGLNPAGEPLDYTMPRYRMSEADLNDLLDYLKGLE